MKGNPDAPRCGFSRTICGILKDNDVQFGSFDILEDEEVRSGLKTLFDWPTWVWATYVRISSISHTVGSFATDSRNST
jgi:glutaredoxin-related protein